MTKEAVPWNGRLLLSCVEVVVVGVASVFIFFDWISPSFLLVFLV